MNQKPKSLQLADAIDVGVACGLFIPMGVVAAAAPVLREQRVLIVELTCALERLLEAPRLGTNEAMKRAADNARAVLAKARDAN